jgi:diguanylate cyclase (GGDEF)-like protein
MLPNAIVDRLDPAALALIAACCLIGGAVTVALCARSSAAGTAIARTIGAVLAATTCGVTIWSAHVASIVRIDALAGIGYAPFMTGLALVVALVTAATGLSMIGPWRSVAASACGGAVVGAAIVACHYVGVASVRPAGWIVVDQKIFASAAIMAIGLSMAAFAAGARYPGLIGRASAGLTFGAALFVFHFVAASALRLAPNARAASLTNAFDRHDMLVAAGLAFLVALAAALVGLLAELRMKDSGKSARERAFADLTREGIVICEGQRIVDVNKAAARLAGLDPAVMRARAFRDFLDAPDPDRILSASLAKPQEVGLKATGGEPAWVEVSSRDVEMEGRSRRVFTLRDLSETRRKEHQIRHLAYHDPLTGLANRAAFNEALAAALKRGGEVALFCVDLDKFKEVNDVFGHSAGDEILRTAARRIVAAAPDAMVFRLGGDEFVVIGTGPDAGDADKVALRLTERLNTETVVAGRTMRCGASVGFAVYPHHGSDVDQLFANADAALYRAKADGRGLARGFEPEMDLALRERRALQQDLATAISRNEMFLHWMPQANCETGEVVGFEALIRWKHPTRGVVPPVQFIPVAEETAAIVPIGEWVLRTACREAVRWVRPGKVAVNLSPVQFQHGDIVELVHSILIETGLSASRLELEITEGVLLDDLSGALNTLRRLKALGVQIAMDDFGTGYSSLSYLQAFPFDRIKIDASFIRTLSTSPQAKAIVRAVVALGASLDMPITAEGVETPEQRAFLAELHCEEIQGYLVGRPSPVVSFESPFAKQRMRAAG